MLEFARAGAAVGSTTATLEKTRILGAYFRRLGEDDLRRAAVYMSQRAFPPSRRRTLGQACSTLNQLVARAARRDQAERRQGFREHSDLVDRAGNALDGGNHAEGVRLP